MAEEAPKRATPMVSPNRVQMAEYGRNIHLVNAESSEHPEDFLQPEFYAHVAKRMKPFDRIELVSDDGLYWAELLVLTCDVQWAKVELLREIRLPEVDDSAADDRFITKYKGQHLKWCVIRKSDNSIIHQGEPDKATAFGWMESYIRTIGKKAA